MSSHVFARLFAHLFVRLFAIALLLCLGAGRSLAEEALSNGQTIYLPIYSHLYHGDLDRGGKPGETLTSAHISIRNTDSTSSLKVTTARYYDTGGKLLKEYVPVPRSIPPLGTLELFVPHTDVSGGSGANFIIAWTADNPINPPLVEALHADIRASRSVVFITSGRVLKK